MSSVASIVAGRVRVRLTGCPRCDRPVVLDHAGTVDADGTPRPDPALVAIAQRLHLVNCSG